MTTKSQSHRKMALNESTNQNPEATLAMVEKWLMADIDHMQSLLWMIKTDPEIFGFIAQKFHEKMNPKNVVNQIVQALSDQKDQPKQN